MCLAASGIQHCSWFQCLNADLCPKFWCSVASPCNSNPDLLCVCKNVGLDHLVCSLTLFFSQCPRYSEDLLRGLIPSSGHGTGEKECQSCVFCGIQQCHFSPSSAPLKKGMPPPRTSGRQLWSEGSQSGEMSQSAPGVVCSLLIASALVFLRIP